MCTQPDLRLGRLQADVGDVYRTGVEPSGCDLEADLATVEGHSGRSLHCRPGYLARRRVDARRKVDRVDRSSGAVDRLDQLDCALPRLAAETRAEQRVDDHVGLAELALTRPRVDDAHVVPVALQRLARDTSVATVRPGAAGDRPAPRTGERLERDARRGFARALHQLPHVVARFHPAHLVRRVQRLEAHSGATTMATAAASSRE